MSGVDEAVVLDANVLVALVDDTDLTHSRAVQLYRKLSERGATFALVDFLLGEALSVIARRSNDTFSRELRARRRALGGAAQGLGTPELAPPWGVEEDNVVGRYVAAIRDGEVRPLAVEGYARFEEVLGLVRETKGALNVHDAMIVVLQREGLLGPVATFDAALAAVRGFRTVPEAREEPRPPKS